MRRIVGQAEIAQHGQRLRGEGFIEFDDVHVGEAEAGLRQHLAHRGGGAETHDARRHAGRRHADDAGQRLQAVLAGGGFRSDQQRTGAVIDAGRIASGDREFRAVHALQLGQLF